MESKGKRSIGRWRAGALTLWFFGGSALAPLSGGPPRLKMREAAIPAVAGAPPLFRPSALARDGDGVYVLDAGDADIKVFGPDGAYRRSIGRKGSGPAEFRLPADLDVYDNRLIVADSGNRRIQVLDKRGTYLRGFIVKQMPWKVLALEGEKTIVARLAAGPAGPAKVVSCYLENGLEAWSAVEAVSSGDLAGDAMRNQVSLVRDGDGFWIVRHFDDRVIRRMDAGGKPSGSMAPPEGDLPLRAIALPGAGGGKRLLEAFCRACAGDANRLFLLLPEYGEDGDLGPGRTIAVIGPSGAVETLLELPEKMSRIAVRGDIVYALDLEPRLRVFERGRG